MARFLIEVPHGPDVVDCSKAVAILLRTGSHFLTHADWGCRDGVHKAWIVVEVDSHDEARRMVPMEYREKATVVRLNHFDLHKIEQYLKDHAAEA
jgi:hypothetical protein